MIKILCSQFEFNGAIHWRGPVDGIGSLHAEEFEEEDLFEEDASEMFTVYDPLEP